MLRDLYELAITLQKKYISEFQPADVTLTDEFKTRFLAVLKLSGGRIEFNNATSLVQSTEGKRIYVPNQWFVMAAYFSEYVNELKLYRHHLENILSKTYPASKERSEFIKRMREASELQKNDLMKLCTSYFSTILADNDEIDKDSQKVVRFVSDYSWWFGSKTIDRNDYFVSPVLNLLGVVNVSQGYVADICFLYSSDIALLDAANQLAKGIAESAANVLFPVSEERKEYVTRLPGGLNIIVYGAPGTGKSYLLERRFGGPTMTRVVFHPEYSYFDFVGSFRPAPLYRKTDSIILAANGEIFTRGEPVIDYQFVPGPFTCVLVEAYKHPEKMYTLLIEEINRANAAAVFGEIFQLLDRNPDGSGEYTISSSKEIMDYLIGFCDLSDYVKDGVSLPSNMNIVATMNSADQGVHVLDAAFKRRWDFEYLPISVVNAVHEKTLLQYAGRQVAWGDFVNCLNDKLKDLRIEEDRLIGPYFLRPAEIERPTSFSKLLLYLWDDVLRHKRDQFFDDSIRTVADLVFGFSQHDVLLLQEKLDSLQGVLDVIENDDSSILVKNPENDEE